MIWTDGQVLLEHTLTPNNEKLILGGSFTKLVMPILAIYTAINLEQLEMITNVQWSYRETEES